MDHQGLNRRAEASGALRVVVLLQSLLQLACDLLEEGDLLLQVVLHLRLEVTHADLVEVLDLGQCGAGDDVAALVDALRLRPVHLALLHVLLALFHLRQGSCSGIRKSSLFNPGRRHLDNLITSARKQDTYRSHFSSLKTRDLCP